MGVKSHFRKLTYNLTHSLILAHLLYLNSPLLATFFTLSFIDLTLLTLLINLRYSRYSRYQPTSTYTTYYMYVCIYVYMYTYFF
jgi:hypothetical protein